MMQLRIKLLTVCISASLCAAVLSGCSNTETDTETQAITQTESDIEVITFPLPDGPEEADINVEPIADISDEFIRGMDASSVLALENSGVHYYSYEGEEQDVFLTLAQSGVNYIRLRVWNDPYDENGNGYGGGNNDIVTAIELGKRATKYGMKVSIDFHYSDFWADPKRQHVPKAWEGMDIDEKSEALHEFTTESLIKLLEAGVNVEMVQIGNEINKGLAGERALASVFKLLQSGSRAVREISDRYKKDIQIAVHYTNIEDTRGIDKIAANLEEFGLDYDIFALSYYSFWDGTNENMQTVAKNLWDKYGKKVVIAETSYCYTSEDGDGSGNSLLGVDDLVEGYPASVQGQADMIRDISAAANEAGVIGIFYWEGTWIPVGEATADNSPIWEKYGSGWASSYAAEYDPLEAGLYYGGCSWDNQAMFDFDGYPLASLKVFKYLKYGASATATASKEEVPAVFAETTNFVQNPGFEDADTTMWKITYQGSSNPTDYQVMAADAHTGNTALHFWSEASDMEFIVEQELKNLESGKYQLAVFAQGGDISQESVMELYAVTNGTEQSASFHPTTYLDWQNPSISDITITDGTLTIGVRIKCNAKSWGTVDDFTLTRISE